MFWSIIYAKKETLRDQGQTLEVLQNEQIQNQRKNHLNAFAVTFSKPSIDLLTDMTVNAIVS